MSKLDEIILNKHGMTVLAPTQEPTVHVDAVILKDEIKALMLGLVGEDEDMEDSQVLNYKAELREAINNL